MPARRVATGSPVPFEKRSPSAGFPLANRADQRGRSAVARPYPSTHGDAMAQATPATFTQTEDLFQWVTMPTGLPLYVCRPQYGDRIHADARQDTEKELQQFYRPVAYQQIFPSRQGSHYIPIIGEEDIPFSTPDTIDQALQEVETWALASTDNTLKSIESDKGYFSETKADRLRYSSGFLLPSFPPTSSVRINSQELQPLVATPRNRRTGKSFQEQLASIVQAFMVQGTAGPMQTLLDWQTYGLKIHYNTTAAGHITWHSNEEIGYQHIQFTIGDFRGFVHGLVGVTQQKLYDILGVSQTHELPVIP
ncbi:uncharacterized protein KD926_004697 [Aspergillus affinis]|uniref:uncharacterized protein n=1 Tax=Aspergillus affinis TaxID=1070780 RepID=UPI0022FDE62D|nr:uncharacterized protein KD926_004697 [Aspergillus affinis]KAI9035033.1 hypothetical protein KD926_004697 [Aspergillus affinis]